MQTILCVQEISLKPLPPVTPTQIVRSNRDLNAVRAGNHSGMVRPVDILPVKGKGKGRILI